MAKVKNYENLKPKREGMRKKIYKLESPSGSVQARHYTSKRNLRLMAKRKANIAEYEPIVKGHNTHTDVVKSKRLKRALKFKDALKEALTKKIVENEEDDD